MASRSDFQGAMLFFSATTLAASVVLGNEGMSLAECWEVFQDAATRYLPDNLQIWEAGGLASTPEGIFQQIMSLFMAFGWGVGALGAAIWQRLQTAALFFLSVVSGATVNEALAMAGGTMDSTATAALMLQGVAFACAAFGLLGRAKTMMFARKRTPALIPAQLR